MNPLLYLIKVGSVAFLAAAGTAVLVKRLCPRPSDLVAGAVHFKRGMEEFQKGISTVILGTSAEDNPDRARERRSASKIPID
ncbi:MAG: hypothetical protein AB1733_20975 [Thermodesulfobacteriota bacterium]